MIDHDDDAKLGFRALQLLGSIPPAPPGAEEQPELTEGQMLHATAEVLGVELISRIPGDEEPLPPSVSVWVIEAPRRDRPPDRSERECVRDHRRRSQGAAPRGRQRDR